MRLFASAPIYASLLVGVALGAGLCFLVMGEPTLRDLNGLAVPAFSDVSSIKKEGGGVFPVEALDQSEELSPTPKEEEQFFGRGSAVKVEFGLELPQLERQKFPPGESYKMPLPAAISVDNATVEFSSPKGLGEVRSLGIPLQDIDNVY